MITGANRSTIEYWKKIIMIFFFGWMVIWIYRTVLTPIYPDIKETLGINSDAQMSMIPTMFYTFYVMFQIPSGLAADRFGRKRIVMSAFCIFALGVFIISMASSLNLVLIGAALVGIGQSAYFGCAFSITNANVPQDKRGFSSAIVNSGCAVGMAIGLIGASYFVTTLGVDWRILLRCLAGLIVLAVIIFGTQVKVDETTAPVKSKNDGDGEKIDFIKVILNPKLLAAFFFYFATCYGYYMIITWLPAFLQSERGVEGVMIGYISSIVAFSSIPGALLISRIADKYKHKKILILVLLQIASTITLFFAIATANIIILAIALGLYGFLGKMAIDPILVSYVVEFAPKKAYSRVLAFQNFFGMSSSIICSYSTGVISDLTGTKAYGFYIACALLLAAAIMLALVNRKKEDYNGNGLS